MRGDVGVPVAKHDATLRALVLAKGGTFRRLVVSALSDLPGLTVLAALSASDSVLERARREPIDVLFVDIEDMDLVAFGRACAALERAPAWFALLSAEHRHEAAHALLQGAAGVIEHSAADDPTKLRARLRRGLGPRLRETVRPRKLSSRPPRAGLSVAPNSITGLPTPVTGRIRDPKAARRELLAIGCSTGGPPAVSALIQSLPKGFRLPICIVQHMAAQHMGFFIENLSRQLARPVSVASDNLTLELDQVYVAAGDAHMTVERREDGRGSLFLRLNRNAHEHNCRPAVDPFFRSVAAVCGAAAVGVVLTGMGSDGALGALAMRAAGAPILAQNSETSVVWGMPGATYQVGAACAVLPLEQLAGEILLWTMPTQ